MFVDIIFIAYERCKDTTFSQYNGTDGGKKTLWGYDESGMNQGGLCIGYPLLHARQTGSRQLENNLFHGKEEHSLTVKTQNLNGPFNEKAVVFPTYRKTSYLCRQLKMREERTNNHASLILAKLNIRYEYLLQLA